MSGHSDIALMKDFEEFVEHEKTYLAVYDVEGDVCTVQVDLSEEQYQDMLDHPSVYKLIPMSHMHLLPKADYSFLKDLPTYV